MIEFTLALMVLSLALLAFGQYTRDIQQSATAGLHRQTFIRAPHTLTTSIGSSGQCIKDLLLH